MPSSSICEAHTIEHVKFDIEKLYADFHPPDQHVEIDESKTPRDFLNVPDKSWVVLPMFKYHLDHLKPSLSVRTDPYMRPRYRNFLDHAECEPQVNIILYGTNVSNMPTPRRKSLTGQFYGVDFKLAPVPVTTEVKSSKAKTTSKRR